MADLRWQKKKSSKVEIIQSDEEIRKNEEKCTAPQRHEGYHQEYQHTCKGSPYLKLTNRDFPGGPVVRTPHFHCRWHRFNRETKIPHATWHGQEKKKRTKQTKTYFFIKPKIARMIENFYMRFTQIPQL